MNSRDRERLGRRAGRGAIAAAAFVAAGLWFVGALAWAEEAPAPGAYRQEGKDNRGVAYVRTARIERSPDGLRLSLERGGGVFVSGPLVREGARWRFETVLVAGGIADALDGRRVEPTLLRAFYRAAPAGALAGTWRVLAGRRVLESGAETLTPAAPPNEPPPDCPTKVHLSVSVDWEGRELADGNLAAMEAFRAANPDVPLTHFLNAAYFTKPGADRARVAAQMRRVLRPGDETGIHIHGWRSLFAAAGVPYRTTPTFWGANYPLSPVGGDEGHEVEICAYAVPELRAVLRTSRDLLTDAGFAVSGSFRAGGWMADGKVLEALAAEGFGIDSSATDPAWHDELADLPLRARIGEVWPGVTSSSAPFVVNTAAGPILEMPDTGALADYVTPAEMTRHLEEALARCERERKQDLFVHIGFHQETAGRYAARVTEALRAVRAQAPKCLVIETLEAAAPAARAQTQRGGPAGGGGSAGSAGSAGNPGTGANPRDR
ncbi:MAG: hypothetical protein HZA54_19665 [Planctomycetes bacterium]|nr:hypothetical protein [Planctomycetota bacterium]